MKSQTDKANQCMENELSDKTCHKPKCMYSLACNIFVGIFVLIYFKYTLILKEYKTKIT